MPCRSNCLKQWMQAGASFALATALAASASAQNNKNNSAGNKSNNKSQPAQKSEPVQPDKAKAYYHYSLGHMLQERGAMFNRPELLTQAMDELELALKYDPTSSYVSMELADLYAATGRWRSALQEVEDNVRRNPKDPAARRLLGRLYVRLLSGDRGAAAPPPDLQDRAVSEFEQIVKDNPDDVASYLILSQLYRETSQNAKAEEALKRALDVQPDSSDASTQLATLYMDIGQYHGAITLLEKLVAKDEDPDLMGMLAYAYEQVHDYKAAASTYGRALERDAENPTFRKGLADNLLYSHQYDEALEEFQTEVRANPKDSDAYLRLSQIYRAQGKYDQARESLNQAADADPDNLEVQYNIALLDESQGKTEDAIALLKKVLAATAKDGPNFYTAQEKTNRGIFLEKLGSLYSDANNFSAAEKTYEEMAQLGGDVAARAQARLIETYQENHQYDKALESSAEALKNNPKNREIVMARASLLASTGDTNGAVALLQPLITGSDDDRDVWLALSQIQLRVKRFDDAMQSTAKAEALSDSDDEKSYIHFIYGSIWERQRAYDKAEQEFRKALELNPESAMTLNYLGYMFADQGVRLDEATKLIQQALDMEPNSGAYLDSLGWAYYKQNRFDLAERYLQQAVDRIPNDPTIRAHLGDVYFKSGRSPQAVEEWKRALDEWKGLPKNDVDDDEVAKLQQKLHDAGAM